MLAPLDIVAIAAGLTALAVFVAASAALVYVPRHLTRRAANARLREVGRSFGVARPNAAPSLPLMFQLTVATRSLLVGRLGGELALLAFVIGLPLVVFLLTRDVVLVLATLIQVLALNGMRGRDMLSARRRLLDLQTLPTLMRITAALRAGYSLVQAMELIGRTAEFPTREEFTLTVRAISLGQSLDDALGAMAKRIDSVEYQSLAVALAVQRRIGGNLAKVLDDLATTARERISLRQQVAAITAQQRLSAWVLVLLPYAISLAFMLADRTFLQPLVEDPLGRLMVLAASLLLAIGSFALRLAGRVEY